MTDIEVGEKIIGEIVRCKNCNSESLVTVETEHYDTGEMYRDVECEDCGTSYIENWSIDTTEVQYVPEDCEE